MTNIYAAPRADLGRSPESTPRPVSLFLLQAVSTVTFLVTVLGIALRGFILTRQGVLMHFRSDQLWFLAWAGLATFSIALVIGLQRRSKIARLAGLICISLPVWGIVVYWRGLLPSQDSAQIVGRALAMCILAAPFFYWGYAFGFARKARVYFRLKGAIH